MRVAQTLLAAGLICTALGAALVQFVLIGLIGGALLLLAFFLLLFAGLMAWSDSPAQVWRRGAGLALLVVANLLLLGLASYASELAFNSALSSRTGLDAASSAAWVVLGLLSLLPAGALCFGLRFRADWSWLRCVLWGACCLCVCPAAIGLFWLLAPSLPLTA